MSRLVGWGGVGFSYLPIARWPILKSASILPALSLKKTGRR